ncbi:MAG: hypothetical protein WKG07_23200 [Hymenobacter sp.]
MKQLITLLLLTLGLTAAAQPTPTPPRRQHPLLGHHHPNGPQCQRVAGF